MSRYRTSTWRALVAIALLVALVCAAPADAKPKRASPLFHLTYKQRTYDVSLKGIEMTYWEYRHPSGGACDSGYHGDGSQMVTFEMKPRTLIGLFLGIGRPQLVRSLTFFGPENSYPVTATVERHSNQVADSSPPGTTDDETCGGGGGDGGSAGTPSPADCGTRGPLTFEVELDYLQPGKPGRLHVVEMEQSWERLKLDEEYPNCPAVGRALVLDDIEVPLTEARLLGTKKPLRLYAKGRGERPLEGGFVRTNTHYELTIDPR
jgi:hypothetical protein